MCNNCLSINFFVAIWPIQRTVELGSRLITHADKKGQIRQPLLKIDAINCPPDILHMQRAIYTKLLDQVIQFSINQNRKKKLEDEMDRIGVKFRFKNCLLILN